MTTAPPARRAVAITAALATLLAGCASGPSQEQRIADAITANDTLAELVSAAHTRVLALYPDLDLGYDATDLDLGNWTSCSGEPYNNTYDSPEAATWLNGITYTLEPRQPTKALVEPLAQTYVADGWTLVSDDLDDPIPGMSLRKDGYRLHIGGLTQDHLDQFPEAGGRLSLTFYSPCLYSPDNLTEWDPAHPHDFDLARTDE